MKFLLMSPEQLKSNKNWKYHPEAQRKALEAALEKLGWTIPIIVNATTGRIIDGHLRFEIAQEKKYEEIPVVVVELTEEQELTALV
ncbi:MAG: ParB N-terminal domain-containing protein, partial [Candidatus Methanomethylicaceae archaeon]